MKKFGGFDIKSLTAPGYSGISLAARFLTESEKFRYLPHKVIVVAVNYCRYAVYSPPAQRV